MANKSSKTATTETTTETSNVAETNIAPTVKESTNSTVIGGLPDLQETAPQSGSPAAMPLENGEPAENGGLVSQDENASKTENVNEQTGAGAANDAQSQAAQSGEGAKADQDADSEEKTVKGGEMRVASGVHKGRLINEDGTINMNSPTERERRIAADKRAANKAEKAEGESAGEDEKIADEDQEKAAA